MTVWVRWQLLTHEGIIEIDSVFYLQLNFEIRFIVIFYLRIIPEVKCQKERVEWRMSDCPALGVALPR